MFHQKTKALKIIRIRPCSTKQAACNIGTPFLTGPRLWISINDSLQRIMLWKLVWIHVKFIPVRNQFSKTKIGIRFEVYFQLLKFAIYFETCQLIRTHHWYLSIASSLPTYLPLSFSREILCTNYFTPNDLTRNCTRQIFPTQSKYT